MAYEQNYNIFDYCSSIFPKYFEDPLVFLKSLQIISYFESRKDFPYCMDDANAAVAMILGCSLEGLANISYYVNDAKMIWDIKSAMKKFDETNLIPDEKIDAYIDKFKREFQSFCITINHLLSQIYAMNTDQRGLKQIAIQDVQDSKKKLMRFIRNDNEYIDIAMDKSDISFFISSITSTDSK